MFQGCIDCQIESIDYQIQYIDEEIEIKIESIKIELEKLYETYKNKLDVIKQDLIRYMVFNKLFL